MDRRPLVLALALAFSAALTASARADVLVAYDKFVPGQGFDVDVRDLQQGGSPVTLPAGVNTAANEFHPTLSGDGRLLAFERDTLANVPGPERPPVYNKQFVVVDLHAGRIVTPPAFQFSDALRTTPSLSSDGRWLVNGNSPFVNTSARVTLNDLSTGESTPLADSIPTPPQPSCSGADICVAPGSSSEISIPPDAVPIVGETKSLLNPAAGPGASPLVAWTRYTLDRFADGSVAADIALRLHRGGQETLVAHAPGQVFGHPSVFGSNLVSFEAVPVSHDGVAGNGDIYASDAFGNVSRTLPQVNTGADEREPAWTADGRYLAFVRRGSDGHQRVLLFDFANNLLVDPAGLDLGVPPVDARPLGESLALQGGISVAEDATARTETTFLVQPRLTCTQAKGTLQCVAAGTAVIPVKKTTVGILVRRVLGHERLFGRRVLRVGPQIRLPLGTHSGHFRFARPVHVRRGRYVLTLRTFDRHGHVRTLAAPRVVTVR